MVPGLVRFAWAVISGQGFQRASLYFPWDNFHGVEIGGFPGARLLILRGVCFTSCDLNTPPAGPSVALAEIEFEEQLEMVCTTILNLFEDRESRLGLMSWDDPPKVSGLFF